jgi:DNA-binding GntR family transcriptional regulator
MKNELQPSGSAPKVRLADGIYETMLSRLISQQIKPGERITLDGVSRELEVSQTPVREALTRLEADGLVSKTHLVGYRATPALNQDQFEQLFAIRVLLETEAAAQAAFLATTEQRTAMVETADLMDRLSEEDDPEAHATVALEDAKLHDLIAASSGNEFLRDALTRLHPQLHLFRLRLSARPPSAALGEHRQVVEAIVASDPNTARVAMQTHLVHSRDRLRSYFA